MLIAVRAGRTPRWRFPRSGDVRSRCILIAKRQTAAKYFMRRHGALVVRETTKALAASYPYAAGGAEALIKKYNARH